MASKIIALPWVSDGIAGTEQEDVEYLVNAASFHQPVFIMLMEKAWVTDGFDETEREVADNVWLLAEQSESVALQFLTMNFLETIEPTDGLAMEALLTHEPQGLNFLSALIQKQWVVDGPDEFGRGVVRQLNRLAERDLDSALQILAMPFLGTVESDDVEATRFLIELVPYGEEMLAAVARKSWAADGISGYAEIGVMERLVDIAGSDVEAALRMLDSLLLETVELADLDTMSAFAGAAGAGVDFYPALLDKSWMTDGLNRSEFAVVQDLAWIAEHYEEAALSLLYMPFLDDVEPTDKATLEILAQWAVYHRADFQKVIARPSLSGGITDEQAKLVATFADELGIGSHLFIFLLDSEQVTREERIIDLPLAGETNLAIIRTAPGSERSMDLLEHAVRHAEEFMGLPFPTANVIWIFDDSAPAQGGAGTNFGTHIGSLPLYDVDTASDYYAQFTSGHIAHEVAHYYWSSHKGWIDEGITNLMTLASENALTGSPVLGNARPCGYVRTIAELESLDFSQEPEAYVCSYELGERLFVDLYRSLGAERLQQGLRNFYLLSKAEGEAGAVLWDEIGIEHIKTAFRAVEDTDISIVDLVVARWYDGTEPYDTSLQDTSLPNPVLSTVDGRVHTAYLSASREGTPLSTIPASAVDDHLWLLLQYDFFVVSDTKIPLELMHYYEDGFIFARRTETLLANTGDNNILLSQWLHVGQSPDYPWAPGKYEIYVYNEGRKVVEVEYEVTE